MYKDTDSVSHFIYEGTYLVHVFWLIVLGLTTRQPLWVILCRLPEKGGKKIGDSRGDERTG